MKTLNVELLKMEERKPNGGCGVLGGGSGRPMESSCKKCNMNPGEVYLLFLEWLTIEKSHWMLLKIELLLHQLPKRIALEVDWYN